MRRGSERVVGGISSVRFSITDLVSAPGGRTGLPGRTGVKDNLGDGPTAVTAPIPS